MIDGIFIGIACLVVGFMLALFYPPKKRILRKELREKNDELEAALNLEAFLILYSGEKAARYHRKTRISKIEGEIKTLKEKLKNES